MLVVLQLDTAQRFQSHTRKKEGMVLKARADIVFVDFRFI